MVEEELLRKRYIIIPLSQQSPPPWKYTEIIPANSAIVKPGHWKSSVSLNKNFRERNPSPYESLSHPIPDMWPGAIIASPTMIASDWGGPSLEIPG